MAAEKTGQFGLVSLSDRVLLVQYGAPRGAELRDFGGSYPKLPKTADCVAVEAVRPEPLSDCISL